MVTDFVRPTSMEVPGNRGIMQAYRGGEMSHDRRTIRNVDDEIYRIAPKTYDRGAMGRNARDEYGRDLREKRYLHNQMNQMANGGQVQGYSPGGNVIGAFNAVRGFLNSDSILGNIVGSAVKYGLGALAMGASPKDALKYGAATGIVSSLFGQRGAGNSAVTGKAVEGFETEEQATAAMEAANIPKQGAAEFDPLTGTDIGGASYTPEQIETFKASPAGQSALTEITDPIDERGFWESMGQGDLKQAFLPDARAFKENPDYIRQYGGLLGLGIGAGYLSGAFDPQKNEPPPDPFGGQTWQGLMRANPNAYRSAPTFVPRGNANGGIIQSFPRRSGSINGAGTGTSDDIPAMLSDGEFVMTAESVRNAGNGNRELGMERMYDTMHSLEGRA